MNFRYDKSQDMNIEMEKYFSKYLWNCYLWIDIILFQIGEKLYLVSIEKERNRFELGCES